MSKYQKRLLTVPNLKGHSNTKQKEERKKTLIVCEGTKTEPNYLREMIRDLKIPNTEVKVESGRGSSPTRVVQTAIDIFNADRSYEIIYCLCDRDSFGPNLTTAKNHLNNYSFPRRNKGLPGSKYPEKHFIISDPCIEVWFILHFEMITKPFVNGRLSASQMCKRYLSKKHIIDYCEEYDGLYKRLKHKGKDAVENSINLKDWLASQGLSSPDSDIYKLYCYLHKLKY